VGKWKRSNFQRTKGKTEGSASGGKKIHWGGQQGASNREQQHGGEKDCVKGENSSKQCEVAKSKEKTGEIVT